MRDEELRQKAKGKKAEGGRKKESNHESRLAQLDTNETGDEKMGSFGFTVGVVRAGACKLEQVIPYPSPLFVTINRHP
jgi:hypothetical protein